ncbi:lyase family protein [Corynebacterium doosanense]|uniref:3-carboxy-cis,cis-muconate cycloisomerase n=1 Tax=Corynebacterium doosanense CAU 212 = DSM 45436 TaxID=558173 RepID=A0A097IHR4_9CORY|nr:lyase family protein [Corynebacterium doosanense]AIT61668.1 3-carboxy-cis,cis-muconate cycloisomerase [Corynebacterium doosanense CAU 212 = DSM 45436]
MTYSRNTYSDLAAGSPSALGPLSDEFFLRSIVRFEDALARAAAETGAIDAAHTGELSRLFGDYGDNHLDVEEISRASAAGANPAIPIVKQLKARAKESGIDARGIHLGATSQDAVDTALVLCLRTYGAELREDAGELTAVLVNLARQHRDTPMIARTLGQQATPTTFGLIAAGWANAINAAAERLAAEILGLPVQYAGASGTMAAAGSRGLQLHDALAAELGLRSNPVVWHTDRAPLVRLAAALAKLAGQCRKVAEDVIFLSATEVGELQEASPGGSSAMPHKANPAAAVAAAGYARRAPGYAATMFASMDVQLQRGIGSWHAEWQTIRDLAAVTASAVARLHASLDGIKVNTGAMRTNLAATNGAILADSLPASVSGDEIAAALAEGRFDVLLRDHGVDPDPAVHTGRAGELTDRLLETMRSTE